MFVVQPDSKRRYGWFRLQSFFKGVALLSLWALLWLFASDHFGIATDRAHGLIAQVEALLHGCGLRWGCGGAHVQQIASPLYFSLLLLLGRLGLELLWWSQLIGALAMAYALTIYMRMVCHRDWHQQNLKAPIVAGLGFLVMVGSDHWLLQGLTAGSELGLACLSVALLLRAAADAHQEKLSYWLALALLLRPEALLFCLVAPLLFARARRLAFWWPVGASLVLIGLFYGALFPGLGWGAMWGPLQDAAGPGTASLWHYLGHFPWLWLAPATLLLPQQARLARYIMVVGLLWYALLIYNHNGAALNVAALPMTLPLLALGWLGLFVLLTRLADRYVLPNWAEVLLPWAAAIGALASMSYYWHDHHLPTAKPSKKAPPLQQLAQDLKRRYHRSRPIATTIPGQLHSATGRPVTPIRTTAFQPGPKREYVWRGKPQPSMIITSLWQPHEWNQRKLPPSPYPAERALLKLAHEKRINYRIATIKVAKKIHWLVLRKVE